MPGWPCGPVHTQSSLPIRRGLDLCLRSQRPGEEIRLASPQPHPIMTLMPGALGPARLQGRECGRAVLPPVHGRDTHTPVPSPKHGSEEPVVSRPAIPPRWMALGSARMTYS